MVVAARRLGVGSALQYDDWDHIAAVLTPSQWNDLYRRNLSGPQRLHVAVLREAISTLHGRRGGDRRPDVYWQAVRWFMGSPARITYRDCCEVLGYEPVKLRAQIFRRLCVRSVP